MTRPLCRNCTHYTHPGQWSARCDLIAYDYGHGSEWNAARSTRRADNTCPQFEAGVVFERAFERKVA